MGNRDGKTNRSFLFPIDGKETVCLLRYYRDVNIILYLYCSFQIKAL
jgi:hypothetical protein